jgi:hypothetical protein
MLSKFAHQFIIYINIAPKPGWGFPTGKFHMYIMYIELIDNIHRYASTISLLYVILIHKPRTALKLALTRLQ